MTRDHDRLWEAAYAAAFVREFYDLGTARGFSEALDSQSRIAEEARAIADSALEAYIATEPNRP